MRNILLATAALTLIAAPAMAQEPVSPITGSIGYTQLDTDGGDLGARFANILCSVLRCMLRRRAVSETLRSHIS